jgi:hypothetical protein
MSNLFKALIAVSTFSLMIGTVSAQSSILGFEDGSLPSEATINGGDFKVTEGNALDGSYKLQTLQENVGDTEDSEIYFSYDYAKPDYIEFAFKVEGVNTSTDANTAYVYGNDNITGTYEDPDYAFGGGYNPQAGMVGAYYQDDTGTTQFKGFEALNNGKWYRFNLSDIQYNDNTLTIGSATVNGNSIGSDMTVGYDEADKGFANARIETQREVNSSLDGYYDSMTIFSSSSGESSPEFTITPKGGPSKFSDEGSTGSWSPRSRSVVSTGQGKITVSGDVEGSRVVNLRKSDGFACDQFELEKGYVVIEEGGEDKEISYSVDSKENLDCEVTLEGSDGSQTVTLKHRTNRFSAFISRMFSIF